jgi:hypothetical protein
MFARTNSNSEMSIPDSNDNFESIDDKSSNPLILRRMRNSAMPNTMKSDYEKIKFSLNNFLNKDAIQTDAHNIISRDSFEKRRMSLNNSIQMLNREFQRKSFNSIISSKFQESIRRRSGKFNTYQNNHKTNFLSITPTEKLNEQSLRDTIKKLTYSLVNNQDNPTWNKTEIYQHTKNDYRTLIRRSLVFD